MRLNIPDSVRVGETTDSHGNPVVVLEIFGQTVLHASPKDVLTPLMSAEDWGEVFTIRLAGVFANLLLDGSGQNSWTRESPTGREVHKLRSDE